MQLSESIADEPPTTSRWASTLAHATEIPAALLVLAEIVILGGGAFTRYVLHQPITWTDELASILYASAEILRILAVLTFPIMPRAASVLWAQLGIAEPLEDQRLPHAAVWGGLLAGTRTRKGDSLFPRLDSE